MNSKIENIRHSLAHLLGAAVLDLWPDTKLAIGPAIENGFYYDFDFSQPVTEKDLPRIEKRMQEIVKDWKNFQDKTVSKQEAEDYFKENKYKLELIEEIDSKGEKITFYTVGNFTDLCRGGHTENPAKDIEKESWKLERVAGAYWRGDEKNKMLTRIYGLAFETAQELENYIKQVEEAEKRDHKKLGPALDLFTFSPLVGSGLPLWTPKGTVLRNVLDNFVWELREKQGYEKVEIPHITKKELYMTSGHWDKFKDELFKINTREGHEFAMKPMNCPHHTQIYARRPWSYRELPQRYANTTTCYRDEQTGELSGLSRVRAFAQDDAHVFCRMTQVKEEFLKIWDIIQEFYSAFGFNLKVRVSLHDPAHPEKYLGDKEKWTNAENILKEIVETKKVEWFEGKGEAAFYGPKLDFMARDAIGREWQVATIQLDLNMPENFDLTCTNEKGEAERIVMIHAAIMGSIERFLSIAIENFAGALPLWLSPVQVSVLPIGDKNLEYGNIVFKELKKYGIRAEIIEKNETIGKKIREAETQKIPYLVIIGAKEEENKTVTIRKRGGEDLGATSVADFVDKLKKEIESKSL